MLGEHDIEADPDCKYCPKRITRKITDPEKQIIIHEDYDLPAQNDIALIRLNEPIPLFSDDPSISFIQPVCLPWKKNNPARNLADGEQTLVAGWGKTQTVSDNQNVHIYSTKLLKVKAKINNTNCNEVIQQQTSNIYEVDLKSQICAGGEKGKH